MATRKSRAKWQRGAPVVTMSQLEVLERMHGAALVLYGPWGTRPLPWAWWQNWSWHSLSNIIRNGHLFMPVPIQPAKGGKK